VAVAAVAAGSSPPGITEEKEGLHMRYLAGIAVFVCALLALAPAQAAQERIVSFDSHIEVGADSVLTVTETIRVNAQGDEIKRGIYREFPVVYRWPDGRSHTVGFEVLQVLRDGEREPWFQKSSGNAQRVYIGRKEVMLPAGEHTYRITYRTTRQIGFFEDHDELYWNVTGNGWSLPIRDVRARVILPDGATVLRREAYTGRFGQRGRHWQLVPDEEAGSAFENTRELAPGEGFTIVVGWPKGYVAMPTRAQEIRWWLRDNLHWVLAIVFFAALLVYYLTAWIVVGRDPAMGTIIPLFEPPEKVSPAHARYIERLAYDDKALTASVVNLAVNGFLTIDRTEDGHYRLNKSDGEEADMPACRSERDYLNSIFRDSRRVTLKKSKARRPWLARRTHENTVKRECDDVYHSRNGGLYGVGFFASLFAGAPWVYGLIHEASWRAALIAACGVALLALTNMLFRRLLPAPTKLGHQVKRQLAGFRMYLATAEQNRLEALHPPERTPALFERYLPYAIALDVENEWAHQFSDVLAAAALGGAVAASGYQFGWYDSGMDSDGFSARDFGGNFSGSLGSSLSEAAVPPPGTSSGFSSGSGGGSSGFDYSSGGFSGGGFSGGGGGGGGGGGW
jgi:uncharacterized membrane protein YgcG